MKYALSYILLISMNAAVLCWFIQGCRKFGTACSGRARTLDHCEGSGCQIENAPLYECYYVDVNGCFICSFHIRHRYLCDVCREKLIQQMNACVLEYQKQLLDQFPQFSSRGWGKAARYECKKLEVHYVAK